MKQVTVMYYFSLKLTSNYVILHINTMYKGTLSGNNSIVTWCVALVSLSNITVNFAIACYLE